MRPPPAKPINYDDFWWASDGGARVAQVAYEATVTAELRAAGLLRRNRRTS